jgi:hypothetical protein
MFELRCQQFFSPWTALHESGAVIRCQSISRLVAWDLQGFQLRIGITNKVNAIWSLTSRAVREVQAPCYTNKSCICKRCTLGRASKLRGQIPSLLSAAKKLQRALSQFVTPGVSKNDRSAARIAGLQSRRAREREYSS